MTNEGSVISVRIGRGYFMRRYLWMFVVASFLMSAVNVYAQDVTDQSAPARRETSGVITPTSPSAGSRDADALEYDLRMDEIQSGMDELREDVFRSRSRLFLLREQVLNDSLGGAQAVITHVNELMRSFNIVSVVYSLDGTQIYSAHRDGSDIKNQKRVELLRRSVLPGAHNLSVQFVVQGRGRGFFAYPKDYTYTITTSHAFTVDTGQTIELDVIGYLRDGVKSYAERPQIRFVERRERTEDALKKREQDKAQ